MASRVAAGQLDDERAKSAFESLGREEGGDVEGDCMAKEGFGGGVVDDWKRGEDSFIPQEECKAGGGRGGEGRGNLVIAVEAEEAARLIHKQLIQLRANVPFLHVELFLDRADDDAHYVAVFPRGGRLLLLRGGL